MRSFLRCTNDFVPTPIFAQRTPTGAGVVTRKSTPRSGIPPVPCQVGDQPLSQGQDSAAPAGDMKDLRYIFVSPPKYVVGTTVAEPLYFQLLDYPGGMSQFFEDAVTSFIGAPKELAQAAAQFGIERKRARQDTPIRTANGRVSKPVFQRIQELEKALADCRGISRSKVIAGLVQLNLHRLSK